MPKNASNCIFRINNRSVSTLKRSNGGEIRHLIVQSEVKSYNRQPILESNREQINSAY